jgi:hypothetical protein
VWRASLAFDDLISQLPAIDRVLALRPTRATLVIGDIQVDVRAVGSLFVIASGAHSAAQLSFIRPGVLQARRGWVEPASVVNTWPVEKLTEWLKQRRPRTARIRHSA